MKNNFKIVKCNKCGAMAEVLLDCTCKDCGIKCCGEQMQEMSQNNTEYSFEKHMPTFEIVGNYVVATVPHVMEEKHYIEWIGLDSDTINAKKYFKPNEVAKAVFPYVKGAKILSYCNLHGLWSIEI